jgi:hypothetical protein
MSPGRTMTGHRNAFGRWGTGRDLVRLERAHARAVLATGELERFPLVGDLS